VGRVRARNEDAWVVSLRQEQEPASPPGLFAVADGMGGAPAGAEASRLATDALRENFAQSPLWENDPEKALEEAFRAAHEAIRGEVSRHPDQEGMGTTLTVLFLGRGGVWAGHVGDSRLYEFRDDAVHCLTRDHTLAADAVRRGQLEEAELESHPLSHVLTRAVGVGQVARPDVLDLGPPRPGRRFLLCTDGLVRVVPPHEIPSLVGREGDLRSAASALVDTALSRGAPDNVTLILVEILGEADHA
jgi:protein phosphatase